MSVQLEERTAELERAREELARRAVTEERLRLARELHDVVAHAMSVIAVQSGVGAHVANTQPEEAAKALAAIKVTSREALAEMRRLLGVLRDQEIRGRRRARESGVGTRPRARRPGVAGPGHAGRRARCR